ncbi:hypothetical protein HYV31_01295 [candidate division WWE3 bacterium]|nr:hypothetical protein [candidate division WWE3 bacterium]
MNKSPLPFIFTATVILALLVPVSMFLNSLNLVGSEVPTLVVEGGVGSATPTNTQIIPTETPTFAALPTEPEVSPTWTPWTVSTSIPPATRPASWIPWDNVLTEADLTEAGVLVHIFESWAKNSQSCPEARFYVTSVNDIPTDKTQFLIADTDGRFAIADLYLCGDRGGSRFWELHEKKYWGGDEGDSAIEHMSAPGRLWGAGVHRYAIHNVRGVGWFLLTEKQQQDLFRFSKCMEADPGADFSYEEWMKDLIIGKGLAKVSFASLISDDLYEEIIGVTAFKKPIKVLGFDPPLPGTALHGLFPNPEASFALCKSLLRQ